MAINILDLAKGYLTDSIVQKVAGNLNENPSSVNKALGAALPTLLGGLIQNGSSESGLSNIMKVIGSQSNNTGFLDNLGGLLSGGSQTDGLLSGGAGLLSTLFGNQSNTMIDAVSTFAGLKKSSTSSIFSLAAPVLMGVIGKKITGDGSGISGLSSLLKSQKSLVSAALPSGFASTLGFGNILGNMQKSVSNMEHNVQRKASSWNWKPWLLALLGLLLLGFIWKKCSGDIKETSAKIEDTTTSIVDSATSVVESSVEAVGQGMEKLGSFFKKVLPNGIELNIPEFGVESKLISFIEDANATVSKDNWINFDRINFATGSAELTAESAEQVKNISEILKAYPKVKIKIGGYTDNTGDAKLNLKLSADRATTVMKALIANGVAAERLTAEGYGDLHPVASNDTEEGRAQNRRIAIRVDAK